MTCQVGGCHVPGLKDCPDPVGSVDLKKVDLVHEMKIKR